MSKRTPVLLLALLLPARAQDASAGQPREAAAVGVEDRHDDWPAIAAAPDGSVWAAWLSYSDRAARIGLRQYSGGRWGNLQWIPGSAASLFMPQLAIDAANRVWVIWTQDVNGNWDISARRFDPVSQEWGALARLSTNPLPDLNPRAVSDRLGRAAVVWQGFRDGRSNVFLSTLQGDEWSPELRLTNQAANDWEPAAAIDSGGTVWVVWDSYRNGNYDVYMRGAAGGKTITAELAVASSAAFEARPTVAVDAAGRVWIAWETSGANWGKDTGYLIRETEPGTTLGSSRQVRIRCYVNGAFRDPAASLHLAFEGAGELKNRVYQPHVFTDASGNVWVAAKQLRQKASTLTLTQAKADGPRIAHYFEYVLTRLDGDRWTAPAPLPRSWGRPGTRLNAAAAGGALWLIWPTDNRPPAFANRPRRHEVIAGRVAVSGAAPPPALVNPRTESVERRPGHAAESADIAALRAHRADVGRRKLRVFRGDLHRHTEFSWDQGGTTDGSLLDFCRYMLDAADLDFGAITDHQGGGHEYWWWLTQTFTSMYTVPGAYTGIFGFERSIRRPHGHRNVFYPSTEGRVVPFFMRRGIEPFALPGNEQGQESQIGALGEEVAPNDTRLLYEEVRGQGGITIPHTSALHQGTDWRDNDPRVEPVVEIFQGFKTSYEDAGAPLAPDPVKDKAHMERNGYFLDGLVQSAWKKGYRLGVIASSDHNSTHYSYAMVYAADGGREAILDGIRKRRTYGATDNILLEVRMAEHFMGEEFAAERVPPLRVKARGTAPVDKVEIVRDARVVYAASPARSDVDFEFRDGERLPPSTVSYYYVRLLQTDGNVAWSSPIWVATGKGSKP